MKDLTYRFKPPKKEDTKKWETIKYLLGHGFYFQHIYDYENGKMAEYPQNIKDAEVFAEKNNAERILLFRIFDEINSYPEKMTIEQEIKIMQGLENVQLWQILNEKEKFMAILKKIIRSHKNIQNKKDDDRIITERGIFKKWLNANIHFFKENDKEDIFQIIKILSADCM
ncbi:hypothetical protein [Breznakiella homolactica]|uniref:Uncharacterized protein n=1 Tax=Breznakiella homolactica TaxID=2798577 RepID=A0A7T7XQF5_9SPIR|nr:hypothetical protein [Breznakiella homolactica]QQO10606.1 hypothetical protein JFL75_06735 [Breznakiella homolactica]